MTNPQQPSHPDQFPAGPQPGGPGFAVGPAGPDFSAGPQPGGPGFAVGPAGPGQYPAGQVPVGPSGNPSATLAAGPSKRRNVLTSKPVVGVAALLVGLGIGASGRSTSPSAAAPAPAVTVTATATVEVPTATPSSEPSEEPAEEAPAPRDTSYKWGQKVGFTYEDVEITVKVDAPKPSANMFDKDNLEAKVTVCNKGTDTIAELSAQGLGLYAEDKNDGQYDLYGAYRTPEFPVYSWDGAKLKAGKCRTGWVSFKDGRKAVRIATEVSDTTYSWSRTGN